MKSNDSNEQGSEDSWITPGARKVFKIQAALALATAVAVIALVLYRAV